MDLARDLFFAQQALTALFSVTNKLQMQGDKYLGDLTIRQMLAIPAIIHAPNRNATVNHIARQLGTTKQSAKQIVDAMEKKKYVSVSPNELDKRAVNVTVTPEGERAFRVCSERTDVFLADIFHEFTTEDLETLCVLFSKLYRFDGVGQDNFKENVSHHADNADMILRHHQSYMKRRTKTHE
ncbi:MAG: MarR family transcriptional regulator [Syntrophomonadaceae bacterium]|jgi:DNA-binding MarR family transcriptional regulator|nr:MarR family transcriptional regulator [Syntrophomonadaceae bacterium]